jgi:hypothetical protein
VPDVCSRMNSNARASWENFDAKTPIASLCELDTAQVEVGCEGWLDLIAEPAQYPILEPDKIRPNSVIGPMVIEIVHHLCHDVECVKEGLVGPGSNAARSVRAIEVERAIQQRHAFGIKKQAVMCWNVLEDLPRDELELQLIEKIAPVKTLAG